MVKEISKGKERHLSRVTPSVGIAAKWDTLRGFVLRSQGNQYRQGSRRGGDGGKIERREGSEVTPLYVPAASSPETHQGEKRAETGRRSSRQ